MFNAGFELLTAIIFPKYNKYCWSTLMNNKLFTRTYSNNTIKNKIYIRYKTCIIEKNLIKK